jgi:hypothetical protein
MDVEEAVELAVVGVAPTTNLVLEIQSLQRMVHLQVKQELQIPVVVVVVDQRVMHIRVWLLELMDIPNEQLAEMVAPVLSLLNSQFLHWQRQVHLT